MEKMTEKTCPKCEGDKYIDGKTCPECSGKGYVYDYDKNSGDDGININWKTFWMIAGAIFSVAIAGLIVVGLSYCGFIPIPSSVGKNKIISFIINLIPLVIVFMFFKIIMDMVSEGG